MVAQHLEEENKNREDWDAEDREECDDNLVDKSGNVITFDPGRAMDFLLIYSAEV